MFFKRRRAPVQRLYERVLTQARRPEFFGPGRAPDSVDGRFEVLALHMALALRRLRQEGPQGADLAQDLFDAFVSDMDANLRELGAGDSRFGKKMRKIVQSFYGRAKIYDAALAERGSEALQPLLADYVFTESASAVALAELAAYCHDASDKLSATSVEEWLGGADAFPPPPPR